MWLLNRRSVIIGLHLQKLHWAYIGLLCNFCFWYFFEALLNNSWKVSSAFQYCWTKSGPKCFCSSEVVHVHFVHRPSPETNSQRRLLAPLKMGRASKGNDPIPTIHVQVRTVSFRKGNMSRLINTDGLSLTKMTAVRELFRIRRDLQRARDKGNPHPISWAVISSPFLGLRDDTTQSYSDCFISS